MAQTAVQGTPVAAPGLHPCPSLLHFKNITLTVKTVGKIQQSFFCSLSAFITTLMRRPHVSCLGVSGNRGTPWHQEIIALDKIVGAYSKLLHNE